MIASLALIVALGGVSWAAAVLPKNSVGARQLKKHAVSGPKIKKNAVTSAKVKDGSLLAADFVAEQLPGPVTGDLPAGATVRGAFNVDFVAATALQIDGSSISFGLWLAEKPAVVVLGPGAPSTAACPGSPTNPTAAPGTLCVYENTHSSNAQPLTVCDAACTTVGTAERYGAELFVRATNAGRAFIDGSWAATAP